MKTTVFITKEPYSFKNKEIFCDERKKLVSICKSPKAKFEKENIWLFLEDVIEDFLNINPERIIFKKLNNGKWICDSFNFSLSHSDGFLAVAISDKPIGVDIQTFKHIESIKSIVLDELEAKTDYDNLDLLKIFSMKEATFKASNEKCFIPKKVKISESHCKCFVEDNYVLSVCTDDEFEVIKK